MPDKPALMTQKGLPTPGQMRIRATLRIRNDVLIQARKDLKLSQIKLGKAADVPIHYVQALEALRYNGGSILKYAERIAAFLDIPIQQILPKELAGKVFQVNHVSITDVPVDRVLGWANSRLALPAPEDSASKAELKRQIHKVLDGLAPRVRFVLVKRLGLDGKGTMTLKEIGKTLGVTRDRVRQIQLKGTQQLQHPMRSRQLAPFVVDEDPNEEPCPADWMLTPGDFDKWAWKLPFRTREIIKLRYGFGTVGVTYTLEEVSRIFKITRERVRQIEKKGVDKIQRLSEGITR